MNKLGSDYQCFLEEATEHPDPLKHSLAKEEEKEKDEVF